MTILITGVNRGLGKAIAGQAIAQGIPVIGVIRESASGSQVNDLVSKGMKLFTANLANPASISELVEQLSLQNCTPTTLILNAGIMSPDCSEELQAETVQKIIETNLTGPLLLISHLLPYLQSNNGRVIAISSLSARLATDEQRISYPASKAGLSMALSALRLQRQFSSVRFITVEPGYMSTKPRAMGVTYEWAASKILGLATHPNPSNVLSFPLSMALVYRVLNILPIFVLQWIINLRKP